MAAYEFSELEHDPNCFYGFSSAWCETAGDYLAEDAAENYHELHDGDEANWPLTFIIRHPGGNEIGRYKVEREYQPRFAATPVVPV